MPNVKRETFRKKNSKQFCKSEKICDLGEMDFCRIPVFVQLKIQWRSHYNITDDR